MLVIFTRGRSATSITSNKKSPCVAEGSADELMHGGDASGLDREDLGDMSSGSRPGRLTVLSFAAIGILSLACDSSSSPATSGTTLPRNVIVPLNGVNRIFPDITRETSTGRNLTATGNPKATRMVIYETGDGPKNVTITVDQYRSSSDASSASSRLFEKVSRFLDSSRSRFQL